MFYFNMEPRLNRAQYTQDGAMAQQDGRRSCDQEVGGRLHNHSG